MKKITLAIAVLVILSASFIGFSAFKSSSVEPKEDQTTYRWIFWGCRPVGSEYQYTIGSNGRNAFETSDPNPVSTCPGSSSNVCAVRFAVSETDAIPGGGCQPKAGVVIWGVGRPYITCH